MIGYALYYKDIEGYYHAYSNGNIVHVYISKDTAENALEKEKEKLLKQKSPGVIVSKHKWIPFKLVFKTESPTLQDFERNIITQQLNTLTIKQVKLI